MTVAVGLGLLVLGWKYGGASPPPGEVNVSDDVGPALSRSARVGAIALALLTCGAIAVGLFGWGLWSTDRGVARRPQPKGSLLLLLSDPAVEVGLTVSVGEPAEAHPLFTIRLDIDHPDGEVLVDDDVPFRSVQWALLGSGDFAYQPLCVGEQIELSTLGSECELGFGSDPPVEFRWLDEGGRFKGSIGEQPTDVQILRLTDGQATLAFGSISDESGISLLDDGRQVRQFPPVYIDGELPGPVAQRLSGIEVGALPPVAPRALVDFLDPQTGKLIGRGSGALVEVRISDRSEPMTIVGPNNRSVIVGPLFNGDVVTTSAPAAELDGSSILWSSDGDADRAYLWQVENELTRDRLQQNAFLAAVLLGLAGTILVAVLLHLIPRPLR